MTRQLGKAYSVCASRLRESLRQIRSVPAHPVRSGDGTRLRLARRRSIIVPGLAILYMTHLIAAGEVYVDPIGGSDGNAGTSMADACRTIDRAWNLATEGDIVRLKAGIYDASTQGANWRIHIDIPKTVSFEPENLGDTALIRPTNSTGVLFDIADASKTIAFRNLAFEFTATQLFRWRGGAAASALFDSCAIATGPGRVFYVQADPTAQRQIILRDCTINSDNDYPFWIEATGLFWMDGCAFTGTPTRWDSNVFHLTQTIDRLIIGSTTFNVRTHCIRPTRLVSANEVRIVKNTISLSCGEPGYRTAISLHDTPSIGRLFIAGNTIHNLGGNIRGIFVDAPLSGGPPPANPPQNHIGILDNTIHLLDPATSSYGIQVGPNVNGFSCLRNRIHAGDFGILLNGRHGLVHHNLVVTKNPLVVFGGSHNRIQHNTTIAYGVESRAVVFGRYSWFGGDLNQGNHTAAFGDNHVAISGNPDLTAARNALACGFQLMALTKAPGNLQKYGWVTGIGGPGATVTVTIDGWYDSGGIPGAVRPTDGTSFWIVTFPHDNFVTDNVFDASQGYYCMNFDFNPQCGEDFIDFNCYRSGSVFLSNLDYYGLGRAIMSLAGLRSRWATWSRLYPECDAHSIEANPKYVDAENGDYRPSPNSPLINAGSNLFLSSDVFDLDGDQNLTEALPVDLDTNPRVRGGAVDIGAYEFQSSWVRGSPDFDQDGNVDTADLNHLLDCAIGPAVPQSEPNCLDADLDFDGDVDLTDFAKLQRCLGASESDPISDCLP